MQDIEAEFERFAKLIEDRCEDIPRIAIGTKADEERLRQAESLRKLKISFMDRFKINLIEEIDCTDASEVC